MRGEDKYQAAGKGFDQGSFLRFKCGSDQIHVHGPHRIEIPWLKGWVVICKFMQKNECQWDDMGQAHAKIFRDPQEQAQQGAR